MTVPDALPWLVLFVLWIALMAAGLRRRRHLERATDRAFTSKLARVSFGLASAATGAIVPSLWLFMSLAIYGGTVDSNLPWGYSAQFILGVLLIGAAFIAISAIYGYLEHLSS